MIKFIFLILSHRLINGKKFTSISLRMFSEMHKDLCRGNRGLCDAMKPTKGTELLNYLRKVEFKGEDRLKFLT